MTQRDRPSRLRGMALRAAHLALALSTSIAVHPIAIADVSPAHSAQQHFLRGVELYKEGDARSARIEFRRAYDLSPNYRVLYNMGQVDFQLLDYAAALDVFRRYLSQGGAQVPAERRAEVEADIARLESRTGRIRITANVGEADVLVDDMPAAKVAAGAPLIVSEGRRRITLSKIGRMPLTRVVEIAGGDDLGVAFEFPSVSEPVAAGRVLPSHPQRTDVQSARADGGWIGWVVTGALTATGLGLGAASLLTARELSDERNRFPANPGRLDELHQRTQVFAVVADIAGVGAIAVGGATLFLSVQSQRGARTGASLALTAAF